jgi:hypothetical protein
MDAIVTRVQGEPTGAAASAAREDNLGGKDDLWTLAAFGLLAYMISNVLHEGLGHGGAAWLSGAHRITVTSTYMEAGIDNRWIEAAGTLVNLVFGLLGLTALQGMRRVSVPLRLFLWSITAFNLLLGTGYFLFSGIGGIGDWAEWMKGLSPIWAWRVGFAVLGAVSYAAAAWLLARELVRIVGANASQGRMRRMMLVIYLVGGLTAWLAGVWNPLGWKLVLISAAASSFGGASGLMWIPSIAAGVARGMSDKSVAASVSRMPLLWLGGAALLVAYVWILGPGVTFHLAGRG